MEQAIREHFWARNWFFFLLFGIQLGFELNKGRQPKSYVNRNGMFLSWHNFSTGKKLTCNRKPNESLWATLGFCGLPFLSVFTFSTQETSWHDNILCMFRVFFHFFSLKLAMLCVFICWTGLMVSIELV